MSYSHIGGQQRLKAGFSSSSKNYISVVSQHKFGVDLGVLTDALEGSIPTTKENYHLDESYQNTGLMSEGG
jgi:hypothetical protein